MVEAHDGERHEMVCEAENATEVLFACPTCGRRVVVGKSEPKLVVVDRGDFTARHTGSLGGVGLAVGAAG